MLFCPLFTPANLSMRHSILLSKRRHGPSPCPRFEGRRGSHDRRQPGLTTGVTRLEPGAARSGTGAGWVITYDQYRLLWQLHGYMINTGLQVGQGSGVACFSTGKEQTVTRSRETRTEVSPTYRSTRDFTQNILSTRIPRSSLTEPFGDGVGKKTGLLSVTAYVRFSFYRVRKSHRYEENRLVACCQACGAEHTRKPRYTMTPLPRWRTRWRPAVNDSYEYSFEHMVQS